MTSKEGTPSSAAEEIIVWLSEEKRKKAEEDGKFGESQERGLREREERTKRFEEFFKAMDDKLGLTLSLKDLKERLGLENCEIETFFASDHLGTTSFESHLREDGGLHLRMIWECDSKVRNRGRAIDIGAYEDGTIRVKGGEVFVASLSSCDTDFQEKFQASLVKAFKNSRFDYTFVDTGPGG